MCTIFAKILALHIEDEADKKFPNHTGGLQHHLLPSSFQFVNGTSDRRNS